MHVVHRQTCGLIPLCQQKYNAKDMVTEFGDTGVGVFLGLCGKLDQSSSLLDGVGSPHEELGVSWGAPYTPVHTVCCAMQNRQYFFT